MGGDWVGLGGLGGFLIWVISLCDDGVLECRIRAPARRDEYEGYGGLVVSGEAKRGYCALANFLACQLISVYGDASMESLFAALTILVGDKKTRNQNLLGPQKPKDSQMSCFWN